MPQKRQSHVWPHIWRYAVSGALAGAANGVFGAGGGMLLVPLLTRWTGLEDRRAFATALSVILPLSLVSLGVCWLQGGVAVSWPCLAGGFAGGLLGGGLLRRMPTRLLHGALGLLILYGGLRLMGLGWP